MHALRRRTALTAVLLAGAFPATGLAQTPGEEQYQDPFAGEATPTPTPTAIPTPTTGVSEPELQEVAPSAEPAQATQAQASQAPAQLPYTGAGTQAALLAAAGALLLAGGVTVRIRLRDRS